MMSLYLVTDQYGPKIESLQKWTGSSLRSRSKYGQCVSDRNSSGSPGLKSSSFIELAFSRAARSESSLACSMVACMRLLPMVIPPVHGRRSNVLPYYTPCGGRGQGRSFAEVDTVPYHFP